jgi:hypothetical protein
MLSLDSLTFDNSELALERDEAGVRHWRTGEGDLLIVNFYNLPPDFPVDARCIDDLRHFYRESHAPLGMGLIEAEHVGGSERLWIRTIFKKSENPGMTYVGAITIPFRDCSFTVTCVCFEHGMTGLRDSIVLNEWLSGRRESLATPGETIRSMIEREWVQDLYDSTIKTGVLRNVSEDEKYDERFPKHPLSRLRRILNFLQTSIVLKVEGSPYAFSISKPWWRFW